MKGPEDIDIVYTALDNCMGKALDETVETSEKKKVTLRVAAYVNAIMRISKNYVK